MNSKRYICFIVISYISSIFLQNIVLAYSGTINGTFGEDNTIEQDLDTTDPIVCNPSSVVNGTVNATTCVITCNAGYNKSGNVCSIAPSGGGGTVVVSSTGNINTGSISQVTGNVTTLPNVSTGIVVTPNVTNPTKIIYYPVTADSGSVSTGVNNNDIVKKMIEKESIKTIEYPKQVSKPKFELPKLKRLYETGVEDILKVLTTKTKIISNKAIETDPAKWLKPVKLSLASEDLNDWLTILPNKEHKQLDEYIVIPTLGIIVPIVRLSEGTQDYKKMIAGDDVKLDKYLYNGALHYPGSAEAGQEGKYVSFAHSSYWKNKPGSYKTIYNLLPVLSVNDEIWVYKKNGDKYDLYKYLINTSKEIDPSETSVLLPNGGTEIMLFTCTPIGSIKKRWIVEGKLKIDINKENSKKNLIQEDLFDKKMKELNKIKDEISQKIGSIKNLDDSAKQEKIKVILAKVAILRNKLGTNLNNLSEKDLKILYTLNLLEESLKN